ncbi:MAG: ABC transporter ATP-binding protein/permease [Succinivibrionaceae bacterium]|nr:ABC transporter ATP-binding protein/permease [Succinivibrionaceae bacterium]
MEKVWRWFERLIPPFPATELGTPPRGLVRFILFYTRGLWKFLLLMGLLTSLMAAGEALFFTCLGLIVDWTASSDPQEFFSDHRLELAVMLLLAGVILPLATVAHSLLLHQTLSSNYPMQVRWHAHRHMLSQSLSFFSDEFAGRVANKVMQTAMALRTSVMKLNDVFVHMLVYMVMMYWMLCQADLLLSLPLVAWLILYSAAVAYFIPRLRARAQRQADTRSDMVGRIVDSYVNIITVKVFGGKGREARYAKGGMERYIDAEYQAMRMLTLYDVTVQMLNYLLLISLTSIALLLWSRGVVTSGAIAIAMAVAIRIVNMSRWIMWELGAIFENIGTVYDGMKTIARAPAIADPKRGSHAPDHILGGIEFRDVCFGYDSRREILHHLSLSISPGEKVGIVGPSGAGKSTLISLLLRFYEVGSGQILLDGTDIREFMQDELRENFAMVSQDPSLMHRTVGENITYGCGGENLSPGDAGLRRAAELSGALSFIETLSDYRGGQGFGTMVGDRGVTLSGGQRQKIALARVIMRNAKIVILDEATSALDSESEEVIKRNLGKVMGDHTVIAIAHRLSTLLEMDRIVVLDGGRIVEEGTHGDLLSRGGLYARMWSRQAGGFIGA